MLKPDWIAVDWGTSNMRAWAMSASGTVLDEVRSDRGMGSLKPAEFEQALRDAIAPWDHKGAPMIACGMVGAKQGWMEAPYAAVPCAATPEGFTKPDAGDLDVYIIAGLKQADPADVMRGEETQIAGFLSMNKNWDGVICLPGTHTKWAHISADEVVSFQTYMTGDLFAAISGNTVLKHSVNSDDWDNDAFDGGVADAMARPERLAARLFSLRAEGLLNGMQNGTAKARLSGLLIGAELAGAKPYWLGQQVAVIGAGGLCSLYVRALAAQSAPATQVKGDAITLAGLTAAFKRLKG
ncbi:MAG: 2-dehydro-3-deoxygalactonokinase [Loktanella sp.]|jgi:2-dehydro-3-deoxygalactonokinase|nr:2-dehydro-3-deoxygalactonokinase [Loktanella sp.]MDO7606524.1 2-dehydro-3-deoxygalactonokinase [Loktanella sp.]MDO7624552.1 2-dehydro-3-deoxygalactonokinase [Loktanella sp.]MDO7706269.1 2-dehydro-3-deoxygalactonokinase [Loktanella sp.]MDO7729079.1 2-dehydro-3-deoxygalactonokinase [Loktanella sp.]